MPRRLFRRPRASRKSAAQKRRGRAWLRWLRWLRWPYRSRWFSGVRDHAVERVAVGRAGILRRCRRAGQALCRGSYGWLLASPRAAAPKPPRGSRPQSRPSADAPRPPDRPHPSYTLRRGAMPRVRFGGCPQPGSGSPRRRGPEAPRRCPWASYYGYPHPRVSSASFSVRYF